MRPSRLNLLRSISKDHILPQEWGGNDHPTNLRQCCRECNELRARAGHCVGVLACVRAVARSTHQHPGMVLSRWRLPQPIPPNFDMQRHTADWRRDRGMFQR
jgi:hypothetical protein